MKGSIAFSPAGFPIGVSSAQTSAVGDFAKALGNVPAKFAGGISQAKSVGEAWDSLYRTPAERQADVAQREIDALERRKKLLEAKIATHGLEASSREHVTLQELKDRLDRLKTEKEINGLTEPIAAESEAEVALAARKEMLEQLRVELGIARAEAALAGFDDKEDGTQR